MTPYPSRSKRSDPPRRALLRAGGVLTASVLMPPLMTRPARAQAAWPSKPVRLIVPYPPGGPTDTAGRILGAALADRLKQSVIVENKSGASGGIGIDQVVHSPPDGHVLGMMANPTLMSPLLGVKQPFDVQRGTTALGMAYEIPVVLVINERALPGVASLKDLLAAAKTAKKPIAYATPGIGSFGHLVTESLQAITGAEFDHISYKGSAPAVADVLAGHVPMMFSDMIAVLPHIKAGKLRALAVASNGRVPFTPDVPTLAEQGFALEAYSWAGLVGPPGMPAPLVERINAELKAVLAEPSVRDKLLTAGCQASYSTPAKFQEWLVADYAKWGKVIQERRIKSD